MSSLQKNGYVTANPRSTLFPKPVSFLAFGDESDTTLMTCAWITSISELPPMIGAAVRRGFKCNDLARQTKKVQVMIPTDQHLDIIEACVFEQSSTWIDETYGKQDWISPAEPGPAILNGCSVVMECIWQSTHDFGGSHLMHILAPFSTSYADFIMDAEGVVDLSLSATLGFGGGVFWKMDAPLGERANSYPYRPETDKIHTGK